MSWTDTIVASLKECVSEGCSAAEAATHIKRKHRREFSRSAIIGKASRLGLHFKSVAAPHGVARQRYAPLKQSKPQSRRPSAPSKEVAVKPAPAPEPAPQPKADPLAAAITAIVRTHRKNLLDLREGECKWPYGDDPGRMTFCAEPAHAGTPYCQHHFERSCGRGTPGERSALRTALANA